MSDPHGSSAGSLASCFVFITIWDVVEIRQWFLFSSSPAHPTWTDDTLSIQTRVFFHFCGSMYVKLYAIKARKLQVCDCEQAGHANVAKIIPDVVLSKISIYI